MMKNILTYITLILMLVLQSTVCRHIEVLHTIPNLILIFAVCYSMYAEPVKATALSLIAGILFDIMYAQHLGFGALLLMFIGLGLSVLCSDYIHSNIFTVLVNVFLCTFVFEGIYVFMTYFIFDKLTFSQMMLRILCEAVYNVIAGALVMWWAKYLAEFEVRSF